MWIYIYIYIYIERERERESYGASRSIKSPVFRIRISNLKVLMTDLNVEHDLHIEIFLEIKFIFFKTFFYFLNGYKVCRSNDFCTIQN
jgi:hypothetical protein